MKDKKTYDHQPRNKGAVIRQVVEDHLDEVADWEKLAKEIAQRLYGTDNE